MDCGIDRILSYLSCYSAPIIDKKEAENAFTQLVDDVKAGLPSASWQPITVVPTIDSVQSISYQDWQFGAQIDIELLVRPTMEAQHIALRMDQNLSADFPFSILQPTTA